MADAQAAAQFFSRSQAAAQTRNSLNPSLRVEEQQARRALESLNTLTDDWDGYGAVEISKPVRINAWQALRDFVAVGAIPEVSPTTNGTVAFDWQANGARGHCEIGTNSYSMFVTSPNGPTQYFDGTSSTVSDDACAAIASALSRSTIGELPSMTPIRIAGESGH